MSLSPHQRVKQSIDAIEDLGDIFYNVGAPSLEQMSSGAAGRTDPGPPDAAAFKSDKGYQAWGHFQQPDQVKWVHPDPVHTSNWFPGANKLPESFGPPPGRMDDSRGQVLPDVGHEIGSLQQEKVVAGSSGPFSQTPEWETHAMEAVHPAPFLQQPPKPGDASYQPQVMRHVMPDSTLQSFQMAFGPTKQRQAPGFRQTFQAVAATAAPQNLGYEQQKSQQHILQQQLQQVQQQQQMQHFQQQQQQQRRLHQIQQQYHHQRKMQEQMQQMQKSQLQQHRPKTHPHPGSVQPAPVARQPKTGEGQAKAESGTREPSPYPTNAGTKSQAEPQEPQTRSEVPPRRSRRLSKDGISPTSNKPAKEPAPNGGVGGPQGPTGGVIHSTPRRRRTSKEINLETLAQKASEMEFLPAKHDEGRIQPLVIPVSVPVRRAQSQMDPAGPWGPPSGGQGSERKPSVIVTRRRSLRASDALNQDEDESEGSPDKARRRPRPEPLVIPPSVYSVISPYQSHLRSPVRLAHDPLTFPPYTPPPILSPVREGSGLYFSTFLSCIAAGSQSHAPPPTPKRSLLRSSSSEITPPMPPLIGEATPASLEPRINIGVKYQAEVPELRDRASVELEEHRATPVWLPLTKTEPSACQDETGEHLMNLACSSVFCGGGTNVELMHHCLHENHGDVLKTLEVLLRKDPIFAQDHHLSNYHYAGSDCWTVDEKHYFNKGISAYRKDFFLVQKVVQSKTLAQCVEFYYTYKKQVKVGRNGTFTYGPVDHEEPRLAEHKVTPVKPEQTEAAEEESEQTEPGRAGSEDLSVVTRNEGKVLVLSVPRITTLEEVTALKHEMQDPVFVTPKPRPARRSAPSAAPKAPGEPEGIFPCKKCSRVFYKVKSRSAHMKSHAEQEKKAAARLREEEERRREEEERRREEEERRREEEERDGEDEESLVEPGATRDEHWTQ